MFTLSLENFQCYRAATLEVSGFVVLTGSNNRGKSAIVRAFRGIFTNPRGCLCYVRQGAASFSVTLKGPRGKVSWSRGEGLNHYRVDGVDFHRVGQTVPEEALAAGGVRSLAAGTSEVWPQIGSQFTGQVFLLDKSGASLAETMADVSRVGALNTSLRAANRDHRASADMVRSLSLEKGAKEKEVKRLEGALPILLAVEGLRRRKEELERTRALIQSLRALAASRRAHLAEVSRLEALPRPPVTEGLRERAAELGALDHLCHRRVLARLQGALEPPLPAPPSLVGFEGAKARLVDLKTLLKARRAAMAQIRPPLPPAPDTGLLGAARDDLKALVALWARRGAATRELEQASTDVAQCASELSELQAELATRGCPTCGKPLGAPIADSPVCDSSSSSPSP